MRCGVRERQGCHRSVATAEDTGDTRGKDVRIFRGFTVGVQEGVQSSQLVGDLLTRWKDTDKSVCVSARTQAFTVGRRMIRRRRRGHAVTHKS